MSHEHSGDVCRSEKSSLLNTVNAHHVSREK